MGSIVGAAWFFLLLLVLHLAYAMRNRYAWAGFTMRFLRKLNVRNEEQTIIVWIIVGDFLAIVWVIAAAVEHGWIVW